MKHLPLIVAVILTSAVLGSGAYWGSQLRQTPARPVAAVHAAPAPPDIAAAAGLFGGAPAAATAIAFRLKGVIEDGADGVAILAEDGKPALAVGVGQEAAPGTKVTEVHQRYVMLDVGGKPTRLDVPDSASNGPERAPAAPMPVTAAGTPPPVAQPAAGPPPGIANDQMRQQYEERRRQEFEQMERARRGAGMGPPPTT